MREKLIEIIEDYADFLDWDRKESMVDSIMEYLATDNNVGSNDVPDTNVGKWIPVTERLPEESGLFLVYTARGTAMEMEYSAKYKQFNMYDDGIGRPIACSHWMPMPEPPKGE